MESSGFRKRVQYPPNAILDDSDTTSDEVNREARMGKNAAETELEKHLFGDEAGFFEALHSHKGAGYVGHQALLDTSSDEDQSIDEGQEDLQGVSDADLFFLDSGPSEKNAFPTSTWSDDGETNSLGGQPAAWDDSDDERITVSLAAKAQLRKLRLTEAEDVVNGKEYVQRLRRQYQRLHPNPQWACQSASRKRRKIVNGSNGTHGSPRRDSVSEDEEMDSADELIAQPLARLLQDASSLTTLSSPSASMRKWRPEIIDVHRLKDIGKDQPSAVNNLSFHPRHPLVLTSGPSSTMSLYHISPQPPNPNPLLTNLHIRSTPLTTSQFLPPEGNKIFFSGRRRYFYIWDLQSGHVEKVSRVIGHKDEQRSMERFQLSPCGRWMGLVGSSRKGGGFINVLDAKTSQWVAEIRAEGRGGVADFAWWGDGNGMVVLGKGGEAVEWDGREKRIVARWIDEGAVGTTVIALGGQGTGRPNLGNDRWLAVGSSSGIVNVYDRRKWTNADEGIPERPKPVRAFDQLTTPTSHLEFSPNGQLLCMASRWKRDALRLVHLPSCTVYRNWPTAQTPFGRITSVGWSPEGSMLAVGNEQGKCRLWEIRD